MSVQLRKNGKLLIGAKKKKEKNKTSERNPEKNEKELQSSPGNNTQTRKPVTVIAGDSIIQNIRGWSLSTNKVIVKPFPGATIEAMEDYLIPILRKDPENIIIHVGTNDVNCKEPRLTAEGIVNLALQIEGDALNTNIIIAGLVSRADNKEKCQVSTKSSKNPATRTTGTLFNTIMST